jgi:hypothetical protein
MWIQGASASKTAQVRYRLGYATPRSPGLKPNYQYEKRQRELEKKKKKAEKEQKKTSAAETPAEPAAAQEPGIPPQSEQG